MRVIELENGIKVALEERRELGSVTLNLWVKAGAAYEEDRNRGVAHFLEHVLFNGSKKYGKGEIDRIVEEMGGELNAATSYDYTYYYINLPAGRGERGVELLKELVLNPLICEEAVEKEKPIVLEEITRSRDNPQEVFVEEFLRRLYTKAPYRYPILGFPETVSSFTAETLKEFYDSLYKPDRITLVVAGNFERERILREVKELFEEVKGRSSVKEAEAEKELLVPKEFELKHPAVSVPYLMLGWKLPPAGRDDVYYEILDSLLSSGRSALLYRRIREKGLAYAAYSNYQNLLLGSNYSIVAVTDDVERTRKAVKEVIREVLQVSKEEFEFAKAKLRKGELFGRESGEATADAIGYAVGIMEDEGYYSKFFEDLDGAEYEQFLEKIKFLEQEPLVGLLLPETS